MCFLTVLKYTSFVVFYILFPLITFTCKITDILYLLVSYTNDYKTTQRLIIRCTHTAKMYYLPFYISLQFLIISSYFSTPPPQKNSARQFIYYQPSIIFSVVIFCVFPVVIFCFFSVVIFCVFSVVSIKYYFYLSHLFICESDR